MTPPSIIEFPEDPTPQGPLVGLKVLDASAVVAGPWASSQFADLGAEVIMVERVDGADTMRLTGAIDAERDPDQSGCWVSMHRNKRAIALNLRDERAVDILRTLAAEADVFLQNFRPGVAARLGISYDDLAAINPELIYVSVSGFGQTGPYSSQPVYDPIVQGLSGAASAQGGDFIKSIAADKTTAMTSAINVLAAIYARDRGLGGQHIEVSLLESTIAWLWPDAYWNHALPDGTPVPTYDVWYAPYDTADGQLSAVWVSYKQFQGAARAVGRPELAEDPRFASRESRLIHSILMRQEFGKALAEMSTKDAIEALQSADVPCAPVLSRDEVIVDPQVEHTGIIVEMEHPTAGRTLTTRPPATFSKTPTSIRLPAPGRGEHDDEVLSELGYEQARIDELRADGVIL